MTRKKKTRSVGPQAPSLKPREKKYVREELTGRRKKKPKGLAPGSRNNQEADNSSVSSSAQNQDPLHGSKRPIQLTPEVKLPKQPIVDKKPQASLSKVVVDAVPPEQELLAIENDDRLLALLEQVDNDEILKGKDAKYFNTQTARHQELMTLLGYEDEDDFDDDENQGKSLLEQWEDDDDENLQG
jgi:ribosome assembly protein YihI (activator of Der GTPase)